MWTCHKECHFVKLGNVLRHCPVYTAVELTKMRKQGSTPSFITQHFQVFKPKNFPRHFPIPFTKHTKWWSLDVGEHYTVNREWKLPVTCALYFFDQTPPSNNHHHWSCVCPPEVRKMLNWHLEIIYSLSTTESLFLGHPAKDEGGLGMETTSRMCANTGMRDEARS